MLGFLAQRERRVRPFPPAEPSPYFDVGYPFCPTPPPPCRPATGTGGGADRTFCECFSFERSVRFPFAGELDGTFHSRSGPLGKGGGEGTTTAWQWETTRGYRQKVMQPPSPPPLPAAWPSRRPTATRSSDSTSSECARIHPPLPSLPSPPSPLIVADPRGTGRDLGEGHAGVIVPYPHFDGRGRADPPPLVPISRILVTGPPSTRCVESEGPVAGSPRPQGMDVLNVSRYHCQPTCGVC